MARRIAFLFNYPLVDNTALKPDLIRALYGQHRMLVVFGKTHGIASLREERQTVAVQLYTEFFRDPAKYERRPSGSRRREVLRNESSVQAAGLRGDQSGTIFLEPGPRGSRVLTRRR
jgi:hypothetical protein